MGDTLRLTILGCGSSGGVPRLGVGWGDCDPSEPRNNRTRCSLLVERIGASGITRVLIDTSPDMRHQLVREDVHTLDAVLYTHDHADHTHGIDDLRAITFTRKATLPVWAERRTLDILSARFSYVFTQPPGSSYPPILNMNLIDDTPITIEGAGGSLTFAPFTVEHGRIEALGFRIHNAAYLPDVSEIPDAALPALENLDLWILDALRYTPHGTHFHVDKSLEWIERMAPKKAILTNLHTDLDYQTLSAELPDRVSPAYDGRQITFDLA